MIYTRNIAWIDNIKKTTLQEGPLRLVPPGKMPPFDPNSMIYRGDPDCNVVFAKLRYPVFDVAYLRSAT
jgi:hypothetical protein